MKNKSPLATLINRIARINRLVVAYEKATTAVDKSRLAVMIAELNCFA